MSNLKLSKKQFTKAYQWIYGTTKKEAEYIWTIASYEYKLEILRCYTDNCKKLFYYD